MAKHTPDVSILVKNDLPKTATSSDKFLLPTYPNGSVNNFDITQIKTYEKNPRTVKSDKYNDMKESIRRLGVQTPFSITLRPDEDSYTVFGGGNTRLQILKDLYKETNDDKYRYQDLKFISFTDDDTMFIAHIAENQMRSKLPFFNLAKTVAEFKEREMKKRNVTELTDTELFNACKDSGIPIHRQYIETLLFANETAKFLPTELVEKDGSDAIGRPKIEKLMRLEKNILETSRRISADNAEKNQTPDNFDKELFRTEFKNNVADNADHFDKGDFDPIFEMVSRRFARMLSVELSDFKLIFQYVEDPKLEAEMKKQLEAAVEENNEHIIDIEEDSDTENAKKELRDKLVKALNSFFTINPELRSVLTFTLNEDDHVIKYALDESSLTNSEGYVAPEDFSDRSLGLVYGLKLMAHVIAMGVCQSQNDSACIDNIYDSINERFQAETIYCKSIYASDTGLIDLIGSDALMKIDSSFNENMANSYKLLKKCFKIVSAYTKLFSNDFSIEETNDNPEPSE